MEIPSKPDHKTPKEWQHLFEVTFSSPAGQQVLARIISEARCGESVFVSGNARVNDFKQGKQALGIFILKTMTKGSE